MTKLLSDEDAKAINDMFKDGWMELITELVPSEQELDTSDIPWTY